MDDVQFTEEKTLGKLGETPRVDLRAMIQDAVQKVVGKVPPETESDPKMSKKQLEKERLRALKKQNGSAEEGPSVSTQTFEESADTLDTPLQEFTYRNTSRVVDRLQTIIAQNAELLRLATEFMSAFKVSTSKGSKGETPTRKARTQEK